ncbi:sigma-70 family RNA polymerase sigma factor [Paenibacillus spongiae]|uniref:Sigma-70 family RNA polymerase sigma factor n=1 Tax=Paenibacillus spongiae TaxID=2909671 RepID=A0ABY5SBB7_9BACL|nr:sigma-70 family RNA polymerase sigma factor [Paenibacillus spongiae]UVI29593.1 sigma-70 family RNA polymerase sigma factor [Paenibacillus spongiae]
MSRERGGSGLNVVHGLKDKDEAALQALMGQYGDYLLRTAFLLLKDLQSAEEAVQDTFVTAFHKIGQLREEEQLKSWLTRIVINRCRMRQRTWGWRNLLPFARMEDHVEEHHPDPELQVMQRWRNERLSDAVHRLDYIYREAITLYYYNELSIREIASHTGANENTIKARLTRGRLQLRKLLEEGGGYEP